MEEIKKRMIQVICDIQMEVMASDKYKGQWCGNCAIMLVSEEITKELCNKFDIKLKENNGRT